MSQYKIWIFASILLVACSQEEWMRKVAPPAQQEIVRGYIEQLQRGDFEQIRKAVDPSIAKDLTDNTLEKMGHLIPQGAPTSVKLVGANQFSSENVGTKLDLIYEYQLGEQFVLIHVARKMTGGVDTIIGFGVQPLRESKKVGLERMGSAADGKSSGTSVLGGPFA